MRLNRAEWVYMNDNCIFCQIVNGSSPGHKVWEDENHLAFLSIFPNTKGVTVLIPKEHHGSYLFDAPENVITGLVLAAKEVAKKIDIAFEDVGRTGLVAEGFGVDHLHLKLFPLHGTVGDWQKRSSVINDFYKEYPGYISSHDADRADDSELALVAEKIKEV